MRNGTRTRTKLVAQALVPFVGAAVLLAGCDPEPEPEMEPDPDPDAAGEWESLAPVPEERTEVSVTTDGERVFMMGGFIPPDEDHPEDEVAPAAEDMYAYDPGADEWENLGPTPGGTHHAGFNHIDGQLYVVGGYEENTFDPSDHVWIYDIAQEEWSEGEPMPTPRGALAYAVIDGRIHTVGGTVEDIDALDDDEHNTDSPDESVGTHEVYDPEDDSWERHAPMPTARNHHGGENVDGHFVVTAGRAGGEFEMTATEVYDPESGEWEEMAPMPTGRSGVAAEVVGDWFYLFGGETFAEGEERTFDEAERYHLEEDRWEELSPMPTARHGLGATTLNGHIYVVSGGPEPGFAFGDHNERFTP